MLKQLGIILFYLLFHLIVFGQNKTGDWTNQNAIELKGNKFESNEKLNDVFLDKDIVGIGESTHGTHEFQIIKSEFFKYLVVYQNFNVFAIEANFADVYEINDYTKYGRGNLKELIHNLEFWCWQTQELVELIEWIRLYNSSQQENNKISIMGVDIQYGRTNVKHIKSFLEKNNTNFLDSIILTLDIIPNHKRELAKLDSLTRIKIKNVINQLTEDIISNKIAYIQKVGVYEFKLHRTYVKCLNAFLEHDGTSRDKFMANSVELILDLIPESKIMIWAHNGHISKNKIAFSEPLRMGFYLKELFADRYYSIGFDFYKGSFNAVDLEKRMIEEFYVENNIKNCISPYFVNTDFDSFFIELNTIEQNNTLLKRKFKKKLLMRNIGAVYNPKYGYYCDTKIFDCYDGLIFVKETKPTILLHLY